KGKQEKVGKEEEIVVFHEMPLRFAGDIRVKNRRGMTMGNAAENERVKLRATFLNNIAVAFFISGFIAPMLTFLSKGYEMQEVIARITWNDVLKWQGKDLGTLYLIAGAAILCLAMSAWFRFLADHAAKNIRD